MLTLFGTNGIHEIDLDNVLYWYQSGNSICFYTSSKNIIVVTLQNSEEVRNTFLVIMNEMFKYTASIPSSNSIVYNLNCKKIISHSVSTTTITVNFNTASLAIVCVSSIHATNHNNYLINIVYSANLALNLVGKTIYRVNPAYTDDPVNRLYNDLQSALTASSSGNIVIVEKSDEDHICNEVILKNGVNIIIEKGANILSDTLNTSHFMFKDNNSIVTCKILGSANLRCDYSNFINLEANSNVYFEFDNAYGTSYFTYNNNGTLRIKYLSVEVFARFFDSDTSFVLFDTDGLYTIAGGELFFPDNLFDTFFAVRNGYYEGGNSYFLSAGSIYDLVYVNARIKTLLVGSYPIDFPNNVHTIRLWNTVLIGVLSDCFHSEFPAILIFMNECEGNKIINPVHTVTGTYTVRSSLAVIE